MNHQSFSRSLGHLLPFIDGSVWIHHEFSATAEEYPQSNDNPEEPKMKRMMSLSCATLLLGASMGAPALADGGREFFTNENIGRIVGTGVGALLGSEIGKGRGNDVAIAAGAVGGYLLGGKVGREWNGSSGSRAYPAQSRQYRQSAASNTGYLYPVQSMPDLEHIDAPYRANTASNVRGGPSMRYQVVDGLRQGEQVRVLGRVVDTNWFMVAREDIIQGFVHMNLLDPEPAYYAYSRR